MGRCLLTPPLPPHPPVLLLVLAAEGRGPALPGWRWRRRGSLQSRPSAHGFHASVRPPTVLGVSDNGVAVPCLWPAPPARLLWLPRVPPGTELLGSPGRACFSHRVGVKPKDLVQVLQKVQMDGAHRQAIVEVPAARPPWRVLRGPSHRSPGPAAPLWDKGVGRGRQGWCSPVRVGSLLLWAPLPWARADPCDPCFAEGAFLRRWPAVSGRVPEPLQRA